MSHLQTIQHLVRRQIKCRNSKSVEIQKQSYRQWENRTSYKDRPVKRALTATKTPPIRTMPEVVKQREHSLMDLAYVQRST